MRVWLLAAVAFAGSVCAQASSDGLRIAAWNITFYDGGFGDEIANVIYGEYEGRSMAPDVVALQEFSGTGALADFVAALNGAPGSPGDWVASPMLTGRTLNTALTYRSSKLDFLGRQVISTQSSSGPPRGVQRWDFELNGYDSEGGRLSIYSVHFKAGSSGSDQNRRRIEAEIIRRDSASLPGQRAFVIAGDLNIQRASQAAYVELVSEATPRDLSGDGRFIDPIATPGDWQNNGAFTFVHTQDPATQVDDRYDQILVSEELVDRQGLEYVGDAMAPYSTVTWDDPNHSYRAWGNDGRSFDRSFGATNEMVGPSIAADIVTLCFGGGHMPVFLDLRVPARVAVAESVDLGVVSPGAGFSLGLAHGGDVGLWGEAGLDSLNYLALPGGAVSMPIAFGELAPGAATSLVGSAPLSEGPFVGDITISSNDPDRPAVVVSVTGVVSVCRADVNGDGSLTPTDLNAWILAFNTGDAAADQNGDGEVTPNDFSAWLLNYNAGCG
ncbi:MAG: GC-type dockerin domain-anchored protein [Planctomycetota bacterium]